MVCASTGSKAKRTAVATAVSTNAKRTTVSTAVPSEPADDNFTLSAKAVPMTTNPSYKLLQLKTNNDEVIYANM